MDPGRPWCHSWRAENEEQGSNRQRLAARRPGPGHQDRTCARRRDRSFGAAQSPPRTRLMPNPGTDGGRSRPSSRVHEPGNYPGSRCPTRVFRALLMSSKAPLASCSQGAAGAGRWLLMAVRGHAPGVRRPGSQRCGAVERPPVFWPGVSQRIALQNLSEVSPKTTSSKCSVILGSGGSASLRRSRGLSAGVTSSR